MTRLAQRAAEVAGERDHRIDHERARPVVRSKLLKDNPKIATVLDSVSAKLTTVELTRLNLQVADDRPPADAADGWLRAHTIIG